jgi:hypothetical protein
VLLCGVALAAVLARQYATVRDNSRLLSELAEREAQLRHQAFHDGLTGLANRALFRDRVGHALELHRRDLRRSPCCSATSTTSRSSTTPRARRRRRPAGAGRRAAARRAAQRRHAGPARR